MPAECRWRPLLSGVPQESGRQATCGKSWLSESDADPSYQYAKSVGNPDLRNRPSAAGRKMDGQPGE